jgi:CheY-like chemotaxis protein
MMDRQLSHLVRLIDDLLDISRVSQGKIELRKETILAADICRSALETSRPLIDAANHVLTVDIPLEPIWLDADLMRLAQVVANLLNNAAKYTPKGGRIKLSVQSHDDAAAIVVSDNGIGIPENMLAKVFQLFAQVDNRADLTQGGLGIGLALVKKLVVMHGGSVEAESAGVGQGSTFTVRLPIATNLGSSSEVRRPNIKTASVRRLKILVIDDSIEVAQTIGWMLEEIGHDYRLEHDGRNALQAAKEFEPDAVLLDIGLPGMDGYAVCRAFREDEHFKSTTIIAQSGRGRDRDKSSSPEAGFDYHLVKPVALEDLERLFAEVQRDRPVNGPVDTAISTPRP